MAAAWKTPPTTRMIDCLQHPVGQVDASHVFYAMCIDVYGQLTNQTAQFRAHHYMPMVKDQLKRTLIRLHCLSKYSNSDAHSNFCLKGSLTIYNQMLMITNFDH